MNKETIIIICNGKVFEIPIAPLSESDRITRLNGVWGVLHIERKERGNE